MLLYRDLDLGGEAAPLELREELVLLVMEMPLHRPADEGDQAVLLGRGALARALGELRQARRHLAGSIFLAEELGKHAIVFHALLRQS
jgi:hypothetical protein